MDETLLQYIFHQQKVSACWIASAVTAAAEGEGNFFNNYTPYWLLIFIMYQSRYYCKHVNMQYPIF